MPDYSPPLVGLFFLKNNDFVKKTIVCPLISILGNSIDLSHGILGAKVGAIGAKVGAIGAIGAIGANDRKKNWRSVTERHWRLYLGALGAKIGAIGANPCANLGAAWRQGPPRAPIDWRHWRQSWRQEFHGLDRYYCPILFIEYSSVPNKREGLNYCPGMCIFEKSRKRGRGLQ